MKLREVLTPGLVETIEGFKELKTMSQQAFDDIVEDKSDDIDALQIRVGKEWIVDWLNGILDRVEGTDVADQIAVTFRNFRSAFVSCVYDKVTGKLFTEFTVSYKYNDDDGEVGIVDSEPVIFENYRVSDLLYSPDQNVIDVTKLVMIIRDDLPKIGIN